MSFILAFVLNWLVFCLISLLVRDRIRKLAARQVLFGLSRLKKLKICRLDFLSFFGFLEFLYLNHRLLLISN